jgi:ABC-type sugar transport system permease subunit
MDGAPALKWFAHIILPHLGRAITIDILIQSIFLRSLFAEIFVTTGGAFGSRTLTFLIFQRVLESQNIGLTIFLPILWTILTSFKTEGQAISDPPIFLFSDWTLEN